MIRYATGPEGYPTLSGHHTSPRPLHAALAHIMANLMLGRCDPRRLEILNRLYMSLSPADQIRCRWEMLEVREAKRGNRPARIMGE